VSLNGDKRSQIGRPTSSKSIKSTIRHHTSVQVQQKQKIQRKLQYVSSTGTLALNAPEILVDQEDLEMSESDMGTHLVQNNNSSSIDKKHLSAANNTTHFN